MQKPETANKIKAHFHWAGGCRACSFSPQRARPFELESIRLLNLLLLLQNSNSGRYCVLSHSNSIIIIIEFLQYSMPKLPQARMRVESRVECCPVRVHIFRIQYKRVL